MAVKTQSDCLLCRRLAQIEAGTNPYFVAELQSGYAVIGDHQLFPGYSLLLCRHHAPELHLLDVRTRSTFLEEMAILGEAVFRAFRPVKLNYELLGNSIQHMHWHIFPRHEDDPCPNGPVWMLDQGTLTAETTRPSEAELLRLKTALLEELTGLAKGRILRDFTG
ncbi:MAG: HIT family protein [Victivallales bacterium]|jgi:diadenosine tetraphosphate (Ap4A) HIT family hydrolase|nr:HIT family protein [Victivallales bacterium]MBT7303921.1 HIT family protein [Victivallales bacterium]